MDNKYLWLVFVLIAGLCWGTYVPFVAEGGKMLKNSYASFLCVGVAYFLIAVIYPIGILWMRGESPNWSPSAITLATLAGVAGALGALCVIFATASAKMYNTEIGPDGKVLGSPSSLFIAPLIFAAAPLINTLVSLVWHPTKDSILNFHLPETAPHWTFFVGIVLTGTGAALVLYSKALGESAPKPQPAAQAKVEAPVPPPVAAAPE
jgi:drug/metabolite transporter (DMT)-like permease